MSRTIARFSSSVVRSASSTCRSCDFATSVTTEAPLSRSAATSGSSAARTPARRVAPKAASCRVPQVELLAGAAEELGVLGVRARPAALDVADAEVVELPGDGQLVGDGEVQPLLLRAVAQGRVVDVEGALEVHGSLALGRSRAVGAVGQQKNLPWVREVGARGRGPGALGNDGDEARLHDRRVSPRRLVTRATGSRDRSEARQHRGQWSDSGDGAGAGERCAR